MPLYSDLLLHDIGTGDGIAQEAALPAEIRTPALWGLRFRRPLMHDGSAMTPAEAMRQHGGEASGVMERYRSATTDAPRVVRVSRFALKTSHGDTEARRTHFSKCKRDA